MSDSFDGVRAKLDRAHEHREALEGEFRAFLESKPYRIPHEFDADRGCYVWRLKVIREPPAMRWGVLVGDFVQNLRSALDHSVWALLPKRKSRKAQYPIFSKELDYLCRSPEMLRGIAADAEALIRKTQPYNGGNRIKRHPLAALVDMSNVDKHRLVHPAWATFADQTPEIDVEFLEDSPDGLAEVFYFHNITLEDGAEFMHLVLSPAENEPNVNVKGGVAIDIAFGERRIRRTDLTRLEISVSEIVEGLSEFAR